MEEYTYIHQTFEKENHAGNRLTDREFDGCTFINCDFSNCDFSGTIFIDCAFIDCNIGLIMVNKSGFKSVTFKTCKVLGIQFNQCDDFLFDVSFEDCILDYCSFSNKKMPKTIFKNCVMKEVSFVGANLTQAIFDNCNLERAIFNATNLANADFRTAYNYAIDPEYNPMKKAKFSTQGIAGLLEKYDIKII